MRPTARDHPLQEEQIEQSKVNVKNFNDNIKNRIETCSVGLKQDEKFENFLARLEELYLNLKQRKQRGDSLD